MKKINFKEAGTNAVGLVAGAVGANVMVSKLATKVTNPKVRAAIPLVLGLFLMTQKSQMIKMAGAGLAAGGGSKLLGAAVPALAGVCGVGEIEGVYDELLQGVSDDLNLGDADDMGSVLNGPDDMVGGVYDEMGSVLNGGGEDFME